MLKQIFQHLHDANLTPGVPFDQRIATVQLRLFRPWL